MRKKFKKFYDSVSERDQRNLIGLHFSILGPGSEQYLSNLFGCDINIIHDCNSSRYYIFKADLQNLANEIGIEIRMAHYLPYCSKYNLIEHRAFCHISRGWNGVIFKSIDVVKELAEKVTTSSGFRVITQIKDKVFKTKRKVTDKFKENMPIIKDKYLGDWNYRVVPQNK